MATVRQGNKSVLVIVDVQVGVVAEAHDADRVVSNIALAVDRARQADVPVMWVQHSDDELAYGSDAWQWAPPLVPAEGETRVYKHFNSSFENTDLENHLATTNATHIALAGAASNWCIRATAYGALERGYDLTLISDAHTTGSIDLGDGKVVEAASIIADLNICMTWVSYPGRTSSTAKAAAVTFN
jgi:nicotinamidase-related amidase